MNISALYRILLSVVLPILLFSCFAAKDYERPEIIDQAAFRTDSLPHDTLSIANLPWKEVFTDPILQGYIMDGLDNNIDIRIAIQQIAKSEAFFKQGKAAKYPTLQGNAQYTHQELSENSQFGAQFSELDIYQLSGNLSWEADIWGRIRSQKRAFEALLFADRSGTSGG